MSKIEVNFINDAYSKMMALVDHFDTEVGWCGTVERVSSNKFRITDIVVYPQEVTGGTVNTDQGEYAMWYCSLSDEVFENLHFQGHSHVNMPPTPSGTDEADQRSTIESAGTAPFKIFMIVNKRRNYNIRLYDLENDVMYTTADILVTVGDFDKKKFLDSVKHFVKQKESKRYRIKQCWKGGYMYEPVEN